MQLVGELRATFEARQRVYELVEIGCKTWQCQGNQCQLTRRRISAYVTIHLQCLTCGRSLGGALPRQQFNFWQDFPEWSDDLLTQWNAKAEQRNDDALAAFNQRNEQANQERAAEYLQRRRDYHAWLQTSPDWQAIRALVLHRANNLCEACLRQPATQVHHQTYANGWLPPAWELKAVCKPCHDRLHDWRSTGLNENLGPEKLPYA